MYNVPLYETRIQQTGTLQVPHQKLENTNEVAKVVHHLIGDRDKEVLLILCLNAWDEICGVEFVAQGNAHRATTSISDIFKVAINKGASSIILGHNHPLSSRVGPSEADIKSTKDIIQACKTFSICLKDHIIVNSAGDYYSILTGIKEEKEQKPTEPKLPAERQKKQEEMKSFAREVIEGTIGVVGLLVKGAVFVGVHLIIAMFLLEFTKLSGSWGLSHVFLLLMAMTGYLGFLHMFFRPINVSEISPVRETILRNRRVHEIARESVQGPGGK